jgi:ligand-binding sensor domain-containing protein/two-component sensor histidine kinase
VHRLSLIIALLCVCNLVCLSQDERQYAFTHYSTDKGLAGYEVKAIQQDKAGYIWIGSVTGLQRFDGTRFLTFRHKSSDSASIPENNINRLFPDKKDKLWIITSSGHAGTFDTRRFKFKPATIAYTKKNSVQAEKSFFSDSRGNVYLLCFRTELLVYNEKQNSFVPANHLMPLPPKWPVLGFCEDVKTGKFYIGTDSGLVVFNSRTNKLSYRGHNVENEPVIEQYSHLTYGGPMLLDSKHRLWLITWPPTVGCPSFYCYNLATNTTLLKNYSFLPLIKEYHEPSGMMEQKNGTVWIRGTKIFASYLEKENRFQLVHNGYTNDQSIAFEALHDLKEDGEENLWVATNNNGLFRFNPSREFFTNVHHINRLTNKRGEGSPLSFIADYNNTTLMCAWGNGIYRFDSNFNNIPLKIKGIAENNSIIVWNMLQSSDSNIVWMGTQPGGLYKYNRKTQSAVYYEIPAIEKSTVRQIAEDKNGNLWLGTHTRGLFKYTKTGTEYNFTKNVEKITAVDDRTIHALTVDKNGNLLVGTSANGVYIIDTRSNNPLQHFTTEGPPQQRLQSMYASSFCIFNDTTIFIGGVGLNMYNPVKQTIRKIFTPPDMPSDIAAIQKDGDQNIWVTLSTGMFKLNPNFQRVFMLFDRIEGITNDHFINNASAILPDGRMVFGSSNHFIAFAPEKIIASDSLPDVSISGFKILNKPVAVDSLLNLKLIELGPTENSITIELSYLLYGCNSILKYKLEGIDKDWVHADVTNQAVYPYLPTGTYTFKALTEGGDGKPAKNITTLIIKVRPRYWQTWWFFGLIIFTGVGVFLWVDKLRMQKIKATESVRNRIATSLTEDMGNSLSSINITSELAKTKIDNDTERTKEYINQISDSSNRMVQAMYDMVWSINPVNDTLQHTIDRMKSYAAEMESMYSPSIIFQVDEQAKDLRLRMETRYEMLSIFKEAVNNAARHAQAKYIEVSLQYKNSTITLCIRDDGKGFNVELVELSRGLSEMRRRAGTINAKHTLKSEINTGTTVVLTMVQ